MKSPSASVSSSTLCGYHTKFGKIATKCQPPCSMSGKCFTQLVMATTGLGNDSCLLFLNDCTSGQHYLVDSGAEVSVLPATTSDCREKKKGSHLQAANGTYIPTYGTRTLSLDLGMDHKFTWTFIVSDVSKPFLVADFLHHSELLIDFACKCLINRDRHLAAPCSIHLVIKLLLSATLQNHQFIVLSYNLFLFSQNPVSITAIFDTMLLITLSQTDHQS